jgi:hypothetical protein
MAIFLIKPHKEEQAQLQSNTAVFSSSIFGVLKISDL